MTARSQIYHCKVCGNIVDVAIAGAGTLSCCNQPMTHEAPNSVEASKEKHIPVVEETADNRRRVKVGSIPHPMEEKHHIAWIETVREGRVNRVYLKPGEAPEALFCVIAEGSIIRAYCNLHGLWKAN
jgi:superoxide reductase